jgi:hypothetical protein
MIELTTRVIAVTIESLFAQTRPFSKERLDQIGLAQALFWGEYNETFSAGRTGVFEEGVVKVHLCFGSRFLPASKRSSAGRPKGARRARSLVSIAFIRE